MKTTEFETVIYELDPPVARIILNRPERANAKSSAMVRDVERCLDEAHRDWDVKVLILKANGKGFCAGHDLTPGALPEIAESLERQGSSHVAHTDLFLWPVLRLWEFSKPVIAQVHGYALGGGTYFAFLPDITIASEDAYFQMPLVQGLGFPGGETMIEPWLFMNWKRTAEYLYTSQTLSAAEALEMGLLNRVVARDELETVVEQLARDIARAPLSTLMATKCLIKRAWELMGLRMHLQMSNDFTTICEHFSDAKELREAGAGALSPRRQADSRRKVSDD